MNASQEGPARLVVVVPPSVAGGSEDHLRWFAGLKEARAHALEYFLAGDSVETSVLVAVDEQAAEGVPGWASEDLEWNRAGVRDWLKLELELGS
jgi:hypothetical protein